MGCSLFSLTKLFGPGYTIIPTEGDIRSVMITELDTRKLRLATMLLNCGPYEKGREKPRFPQEEVFFTRLGIRALWTFWSNQQLIPEEWKKKKNGKPIYIFFDGTHLSYKHNSHGRYAPCLYWYVDKTWRLGTACLDREGWNANDFSAVLLP